MARSRTAGLRTASAAPAAAGKRKKGRSIAGVIMLFVNTLSICALALTGYAGYVSPLSHSGLWGVLPLAFTPLLLWCVFILCIDLFWFRRCAAVMVLGMAACYNPIRANCPLHLFSPSVPAGTETFTLMSYNVHGWGMVDGLPYTQNPMLDYILAKDADVVCLQEAYGLRQYRWSRITAAQIDSINARYPYIFVGGKGMQSIYSKYPLTPIHLDATKKNFAAGVLAAYRMTLPSGRLVSIFNVHLASIGLKDEDKEMYERLTELKTEPLHDVRVQLIDKLSAASRRRARQVQQLMRWIRLYGGPDCIVAGDFNDVPDCYSITSLADCGFADVYGRVGFGPMITYNSNRFYFCIDHILSRGDLKPLWLKKGRLRGSDHYPIMTEFAVE